MKDFNLVSPCCHKSIAEGIAYEYPLGGNTWRIPYKKEICEGCGLEVTTPVEECGICGVVGCENECEEVDADEK